MSNEGGPVLAHPRMARVEVYAKHFNILFREHPSDCVVVRKGLPDDARFVWAHRDFMGPSINLTFVSESFDEIPDTSEVPVVPVEFVRVDLRRVVSGLRKVLEGIRWVEENCRVKPQPGDGPGMHTFSLDGFKEHVESMIERIVRDVPAAGIEPEAAGNDRH